MDMQRVPRVSVWQGERSPTTLCPPRVCSHPEGHQMPWGAHSALGEDLPHSHAECSNPKSVISCLHFLFLPAGFF